MTSIDKQTRKTFSAVVPQLPDLQSPIGEAAAAWSAFCDRLKHAGHLVLSQPEAQDAVMQAETLRYLIRELRYGIEWETEHQDPDFPRLFLRDHSGSGPPGPNLDNAYYAARVRGGARYRLRIDARRLGGLIVGLTAEDNRRYNDYSLDDFIRGEDGLIDIEIGTEHMPGNWIELPDDAWQVQIRLYCMDWDDHRPGLVAIDRLDAAGQAPAIPTVGQLADALDATVDHLESWPFRYPVFQTRYADQVPANVMRPPLGIPGGVQEIRYGLSRYHVRDDEALIVETDVPDAPYWGFHVYTMPWFSQIDPAYRLTALNNAQCDIDADGKARFVVAHADPGVRNWLDAGGFETGAIFYRWIWSKDSPTPRARLVKFAELRDHLPARTPAFSPGARTEQMAARRLHLQRRMRA